MSNPYDPTPPPSGPEQRPPAPSFPPYAGGTPAGPPAGPPGGPPGGPWGPAGPAPYSYPMPPPTDAVSITGFVLSLTFCLSVVGLVLGLVGLSRTKGGKRKGRWAAVSAIAVGAVLTAVTVLFAVLVGVQIASVVDPEDAEAGQCVDIDTEDGELTFTETGCDEGHDAEIVQVGQIGDQDPNAFTGPEQLCREAMPDDAEARVDGFSTDLEWSIATEDPDDPAAEDRYLCYVEPASGELEAPILG